MHTIVEEESRKDGLEMKRNNECPQINIFIKGNNLKQRDQFKYLST